MKAIRNHQAVERGRALLALKLAVLEGIVWRYEYLLAQAVAAGATEQDIDTTAHEAVQELLVLAEQPLTMREADEF